LTDHNKATHDALGINAATLEGSTTVQVQAHAPASHGNEVHSSVFITSSDDAKDFTYYRRTGATRARWFTVATTATAMTVSTALTADRIYAHPFNVPKTITLDKIGVNCTTLVAGGSLRLGIYSDSNGEPSALVLDAGTVDTSGTGVKTIDINQQLTPNMYWLAAASKSATHAFRVPAIAATINVCGVIDTLPTAVGTHFYAAHAFGALPNPFPAVTSGTSLVYPAVFVRLSA
jgi:hypothetical protein